MRVPKGKFPENKKGYGKKRCPKCGNWMVIRTNTYGKKFWGCTSFFCHETSAYLSGADVLEFGIRECPKCGREMAVRRGRYGEFWGCTNYPKCDYTEDYDEERSGDYEYVSLPRDYYKKASSTDSSPEQTTSIRASAKNTAPRADSNHKSEKNENKTIGVKTCISREELKKEAARRKQLVGLFVKEKGGRGIYQPDGKMIFSYFKQEDIQVYGVRQAVANCSGIAYVTFDNKCGSIVFRQYYDSTGNIESKDKVNMDVKSWTNIEFLDSTAHNAVGLTYNGKVLTTFDNKNKLAAVSQWENVSDLCCGDGFIAGLNDNGDLLMQGDCWNYCNKFRAITNAYLITASRRYGDSAFLAVTENGSLFYKSRSLNSWDDMQTKAYGIVSGAISRDHIALIDFKNNLYVKEGCKPFNKVKLKETPYCVFTEEGWIYCLTKKGSVYSLASTSRYCYLKGKVIDSVDAEFERREKISEFSKICAARGIEKKCPYCGGAIKGLLNKTCTKCGRKNKNFTFFEAYSKGEIEQ